MKKSLLWVFFSALLETLLENIYLFCAFWFIRAALKAFIDNQGIINAILAAFMLFLWLSDRIKNENKAVIKDQADEIKSLENKIVASNADLLRQIHKLIKE